MNSSVFSTQYHKTALFKVNENTFEQTAIELFNYQYANTPVYKSFVNYLNVNPNSIMSIEQIPFLPIRFFKSHKVHNPNVEIEKVFESSGTTGMTSSKHYFEDVPFYLENCKQIFESFYGDLSGYSIIALLPSYIERGNSSLTAMCDYFMKVSESQESGFYLDNYKELVFQLNVLKKNKKKVLLIGVTFALLDLAENYSLDLPDDWIVMETGGMKGRREEMTREDVHKTLKNSFNIEHIHSEYGMTELNSQLYSKSKGVFQSPNWVRTICRDINDPLSVGGVMSGPLNIIDLANVNSCAFIATDDLAKLSDDNTLEIIGRIDNSDVRGCNLLVV